MKLLSKSIVAVTATIAMSSYANAQQGGGYLSISGGLTKMQSSSNEGALTSAFTTGAGTTIPAGTVLASGTSLGWNTKFKSGYNAGIAAGYRYGNGLRGEIEVRYFRNSIESHNSVSVGGGSIDAEDAGVLITGSGNLGASVATIVSAGTGNSSTWAFMVNGYYDLLPDAQFSPYLGVGVGYADTNVTFAPSDVSIANSGNGGFAYQGIVGAQYNITSNTGIFAEYRYFARDKVNVNLSLLPGYLDTESKSHLFNVGFKVGF